MNKYYTMAIYRGGISSIQDLIAREEISATLNSRFLDSEKEAQVYITIQNCEKIRENYKTYARSEKEFLKYFKNYRKQIKDSQNIN